MPKYITDNDTVCREFESLVLPMWASSFNLSPDVFEAGAKGLAYMRSDGPTSKRTARVLQDTGIREIWNRKFAEERPVSISKALGDYVEEGERWADILAGDGRIAKKIQASYGIEVDCYERPGAYELQVCKPFALSDLANEAANEPYDVGLFSVVLHHEKDAKSLLDFALPSIKRRAIVIENSVSAKVSKAVHRFADLFFNECLNNFGVDCTTEHRTLGQWVDLLSEYGTIALCQSLGTAPAMPFPYELIVVDLHE